MGPYETQVQGLKTVFIPSTLNAYNSLLHPVQKQVRKPWNNKINKAGKTIMTEAQFGGSIWRPILLLITIVYVEKE